MNGSYQPGDAPQHDDSASSGDGPHDGPGGGATPEPRGGRSGLAMVGVAALVIGVIVLIIALVSDSNTKHATTVTNQSLSVGHTTTVKPTTTSTTTTQQTTITTPTVTVHTATSPPATTTGPPKGASTAPTKTDTTAP